MANYLKTGGSVLSINGEHTDPFFNLAAEEYLLKRFKQDALFFYRNSPSVIVGKHQNTLAEINLSFVREKGIKVARRISGGGAVYHDLGNLNFSFITTGTEGDLVNYKRFTRPVIEMLGELGLEVRLGERNELLLKEWKISGTASHVYKQRVLHHGTLLFSAEMNDLSHALKVKSEQFSDRAVKSIPSKITNISEHIVEKMDIVSFQNRIHDHILSTVDGAEPYRFNDQDLNEINALRESKFSTWEWNFGYSPRYQFNKHLKFKSGNISLHLNVEKGVIREVHIGGDFMSTKDIHALERVIVGTIHDPETLRMRLSGIEVTDYISGLENEELLSGMF